MSSIKSEPERDFFSTGAKTYLDVQDALEEFRRQVMDDCAEAFNGRRADIIDACGSVFSASEELRDNQADSRQWLGKQLPSKHPCRLYISFAWGREKDKDKYKALVHLRRNAVDIAKELWTLREVDLRDNKRLYFPRSLSEREIPDFKEHLDKAITDFIEFIDKAGGLEKYFSQKP